MYLTHSFSDRARRTRAPLFSLRVLVPLLAALVAAPSALAGSALDRIKETRTLKLGYGPETPLIQKDASGKPTGFAIGLCQKIADAAKIELNQPALAVEYVPVTREGGVAAVAQGKVDVLCDPTPPTAAARKQVSFSIPIFASGIGAVLRRDGSHATSTCRSRASTRFVTRSTSSRWSASHPTVEGWRHALRQNAPP